MGDRLSALQRSNRTDSSKGTRAVRPWPAKPAQPTPASVQEPGKNRSKGSKGPKVSKAFQRGQTILAAGAVLWVPGPERKNGKGRKKPRLALVHRPKYDDWSFPKGKLDPGEGWRTAALREVREETGLSCVLGGELPAQHYLAQGRPKEVRYWSAVPTGGSFRPNREVDRLEWLSPKKARARLTHERDRALVDALLELLADHRTDRRA